MKLLKATKYLCSSDQKFPKWINKLIRKSDLTFAFGIAMLDRVEHVSGHNTSACEGDYIVMDIYGDIFCMTNEYYSKVHPNNTDIDWVRDKVKEIKDDSRLLL